MVALKLCKVSRRRKEIRKDRAKLVDIFACLPVTSLVLLLALLLLPTQMLFLCLLNDVDHASPDLEQVSFKQVRTFLSNLLSASGCLRLLM